MPYVSNYTGLAASQALRDCKLTKLYEASTTAPIEWRVDLGRTLKDGE